MSAKPKRFRVAFSFAGEKRDFVKQVADILAERFGEDRVLYDHYHEAEFAHPDLAMELPDLYSNESNLIVSVFCSDYEKKEWCGLEWRAIFSMIKSDQGKQVLLTRFDYAEGKGLQGLSGFIELDKRTPKEASQLILQRLALNEGRAKDYYLAENEEPPKELNARNTIENNLPLLPYFFGREGELAKIAEALHPDARTWGALIDGPGGMGKTSLAIRAAEQVSPRHFDRILFFSAKNRELTPDGEKSISQFSVPAYLEILNGIASQLGKPELAKSSPSDRSSLVLEALRGTKALLIIDNLESLPNEDTDLLFAFLSRLPQGSKALVTSRRRTDIDARILRLEKLNHDAALAYLQELAQDRPLLEAATDEEYESLYLETGGNPLLMRWLVGQLGRGRCLTVTEALDFLRNAPEDNEPLKFVFGDLVVTFTGEETAALCALSYFTKPIEPKHIKSIAGLSTTATETALADLTNRSLVITYDRSKTYFLTPLVGDFLRKARPDVMNETGGRLEKHAYAFIVENGFQEYDRFPALDAAWPMVAPALSLFLAGENARLQQVWVALRDFFDFTGRWDEWFLFSQQAERKAIAASDHETAGCHAYECGYIHCLREEADMVLKCAFRATKFWEQADTSSLQRAYGIRLQGLGYRLKEDYSAALKAFQKALKIYQSCSLESEHVALAINDLGATQQSQGDYSEAAKNYREALRIAKAIKCYEGVATYIGNLSSLALCQEHWAEAETLAREALPLSKSLGSRQLIACDECRLAEALTEQDKAAEALPYVLHAVETFAALGSPSINDAHAVLSKCRLSLSLKKLNHGWTYNTTTIEGNTLTLEETEKVLADPEAPIPGKPLEHSITTRAQAAALKSLADLLREDRDITRDDLFNLHTQLMQGSIVDSLKPIGEWKTEDNGTSIKLDGKIVWNDAYSAARDVSSLMNHWLGELNYHRKNNAEPFEAYIDLHATFARIHPFADGNGRMARMLANIPLLLAGKSPVDIPAKERDRYITALACWQLKCGSPLPSDELMLNKEDLADFIALCMESHPSSEEERC